MRAWIFVLLSMDAMIPFQRAHGFEETDTSSGRSLQIEKQPPGPGYLPEPIYLNETQIDEDESATSPDDHISLSEGDAAQAPKPRPKMTASASLGLSMYSFDGRLNLGYPVHRFLLTDVGINYWNIHRDEAVQTGYGPLVDVVFHLPLLKLIDPFVGVGIAYESWRQKQDEELVERGASWVSSYFFGTSLILTKHFGIKIGRRTKHYAGRAPLAIASENRVADPSYVTEIGFFAKM